MNTWSLPFDWFQNLRHRSRCAPSAARPSRTPAVGCPFPSVARYLPTAHRSRALPLVSSSCAPRNGVVRLGAQRRFPRCACGPFGFGSSHCYSLVCVGVRTDIGVRHTAAPPLAAAGLRQPIRSCGSVCTGVRVRLSAHEEESEREARRKDEGARGDGRGAGVRGWGKWGSTGLTPIDVRVLTTYRAVLRAALYHDVRAERRRVHWHLHAPPASRSAAALL